MKKNGDNTNFDPKKLNFVQEIKAHVSSWKILTKKEAEMVLVESFYVVSLVIAISRLTNHKTLGILACIFTYLFQVN